MHSLCPIDKANKNINLSMSAFPCSRVSWEKRNFIAYLVIDRPHVIVHSLRDMGFYPGRGDTIGACYSLVYV